MRFVMARLTKMIVGTLVVFTMTIPLAPVAHAADPDERDLRGMRKERLFPQRQQYRQRDAMPAQRLSPEERRQLRRDIKDAGREIYPEY